MSAVARGWLLRTNAWTSADSLPLTDRAVRYGMSVFETIGVREGKLLFHDAHARSLAAAARAILGVDAGPGIPPLRPDDRGVLRIYVTGGDGGPADPVCEPRVFAWFEPATGHLPDDQTARLHPDPVAPFAHGAKTGNYGAQCAAQMAARAQGFDHALLSDAQGHLLSGAMGNVFFVREGRLCTPSTVLAVRAGVMRAWVMAQEKVHEGSFAVRDLETAAEIFLTNSRLGVMPLRFGQLPPGPLGCALRDRCRREKLVP